jgi:hypothetical protein
MLPHLRPTDPGEILDGAFRLHLRHLRALLAARVTDVRPLAGRRMAA